MELSIKGKPSYLKNKLIREAVHFFADFLMSPRLHQNVHLTITFESFEGQDCGYCQAHYDGPHARDFDITIKKKLKKYDTLTTIAHEMIHLKQYAKDEYYNYERNPLCHRFKGQKYEVDENGLGYWLSPWEVEAYGSEHGLYEAFIEHQKNQKNK